MDYQAKLKAILTASQWTQEQLASRLGVSFVTLNTWVNGHSVPRKRAQDAIEALYIEIVGAEAVDGAELDARKRLAHTLKLTPKIIISDRRLLDKLTLYLTYHTNTIEGSTMTLQDTEDVLFDHKVLTNRTQIEQAEARNHQAALLWLLDQLMDKDFHITEDLLKGLHLRLMNGIMSNAGVYRNHSVRIMGAHVTLANYQKIPALLDAVIQEANQENDDLVRNLAAIHGKFEQIHPFSDGNGRIGRLLMLAMALKANRVPPIVLKEKRQAYYTYLEFAQMNGEFAPLELFVAGSMIEANELLIGRD